MTDLVPSTDPAPVMKAFSLWQPWASLWLTGYKPTETRHWETPYRGWLAVHAAQRMETNFAQDDPFRALLEDAFGGRWAQDLPTGAILGAVEMISCLPVNQTAPAHDDDRLCGNWADGRYAWRRGRAVSLPSPIPWRGRQRIFSIPAEIAGQIMQQVAL